MNHHVFLPFLLARTASSLATTMLSVAVGWHLYQLSGNPFDLALIGLVQLVPLLALFMVSGWAVDNFPRKRILILCAWGEALVMLGIAILMGNDFESGDKVYLFAFLFLHGCLRAFYSPAQQAILPNIVSRDMLARAVAVTTSVWNIAMTAGPFCAGVLLVQMGYGIYWLFAGLFSIGAIAYVLLPDVIQGAAVAKGWQQMLGGIRFVRGNPFVLGSISLDLLVVVSGSVMALLPVYAIDILRVGPEALGLLRGMPALGAIMVGIAMSYLPEFRHVGRALFLSLILFCCSIIAFAFSTSLYFSLAALWLYGASDMVSVNIRGTLLQLATPDPLRGRVSAVNSIFVSTSNDLGDFRAGSVAAVLPPVVAVALGGFMALGFTLLGSRAFAPIRGLARYADIEERPSSS